MDTQLKKGLLDACVLKCLSKEASYGYKIIVDLDKYIEISESTLYPILKRLEEGKSLITYKEEHNGRIRKYYEITVIGLKKLDDFKDEIGKLKKTFTYILGGKNE
jgi:Predicted transcriptional regulators